MGDDCSGEDSEAHRDERRDRSRFIVEVRQWERLQARAEDLEPRASVDWLFTLATMVAGNAVSAFLGLIALPAATDRGSELSPFVKPTLWTVSIGGALAAIALVIAWANLRATRARLAADIRAEIEKPQRVREEGETSLPQETVDVVE
jgi:hypothetical protein